MDLGTVNILWSHFASRITKTGRYIQASKYCFMADDTAF